MIEDYDSVAQFSQEMINLTVKTIGPEGGKHEISQISFEQDEARFVFILDNEYSAGRVIEGQVYCCFVKRFIGFIKIIDLLAETERFFSFDGGKLAPIKNSSWGNA